MRRITRLFRCTVCGFGRAQHLLEHVRAMPKLGTAALLGGGPALVLAPHPDDESLGCGGLIAQATSAHAEIHILFVTDGGGLHPDPAARAALSRRRHTEALAAAAVLGVAPDHIRFWTVPDGAAPLGGRRGRALGVEVAALARSIGAQTILAPWEFDDHPDHVAAFRYGRRAARLTGAALFAYPVWAWMMPGRAFVPRIRLVGCTLDIRPTLDAKRRAVFQHVSQIAALRPPGAAAELGFALNDEQLARMVTAEEAFIACNAAARRRLAHGHR